jgi:hypothetical protein
MPPKTNPKPAEKSAASAAGGKATPKQSARDLPPVEVQLYSNDYTNKLKDALRKQLQGTKGFPEKLKSVGWPYF